MNEQSGTVEEKKRPFKEAPAISFVNTSLVKSHFFGHWIAFVPETLFFVLSPDKNYSLSYILNFTVYNTVVTPNKGTPNKGIFPYLSQNRQNGK